MSRWYAVPVVCGRDLVRRQAARRFGPDADAEAALASIAEPGDLDELARRVLTAADRPSLPARP